MNADKKHSPLPWEAKSPSLLIVDPYDNVVADCEAETFECERMPNAELIAFACNNHYRLVEALTRLSDVSVVLCNLGKSNFALRADVWTEMYTATDAARAVLAELQESGKSAPLVTQSPQMG